MRSVPALIIGALFIAEMTVTFEASMVYAALPTLISEFGDPMRVGWLVTIHMLIAAASSPVVGRLGDIRGRKRLVLVLLALALVGSVLSAMSTSFAVVLVGRALQGLSAVVLPLSIGIVRESLPEEKVPMGIGLLTTALGAGAASGLVLGGVIVDNLDWHALFWASAIMLAISIAAIAAFVPDRPGTPTRRPIDWVEGLLPVPAIALMLYAIGATKQSGWLAPQVLGMFAVCAVLFAFWARRSLRAEEPFLDLRLFRDRNFAVVNLITVLLGMGTMQIVYVFSAYMQSPGWTAVGLGLTATVAGLAKLPSNFLSFFAGPFAGWLIQRMGNRATVSAGALLAASGWIAAMALPDVLGFVIAMLCVISFGTTILQAALPNIVVATVPQHRTSEAMGSMQVVRGIAAAVGAQIIAMLLASRTVLSPDGGAQFPAPSSYLMTMGVMAGLTFAGAACAMLLRARETKLAPA
ncbi:MFS transporter [Novosphingobium sp. M1R2S20]|uniref:MFS transporter n=1 Tax=Novosphingobium rhizovicinum TaxID=3228928 RepID=A0ABV3R914_9SPHN